MHRLWPDEEYFLMTFFGFLVGGLYFLGKLCNEFEPESQQVTSPERLRLKMSSNILVEGLRTWLPRAYCELNSGPSMSTCT
jgi:hypothetical protein